jgi:hypothetical protein
MNVRRFNEEHAEMKSEPGEFVVAEPVLLIHLNQKLDFARRGTALALTQVEIAVLSKLICDRAQLLADRAERLAPDAQDA